MQVCFVTNRKPASYRGKKGNSVVAVGDQVEKIIADEIAEIERYDDLPYWSGQLRTLRLIGYDGPHMEASRRRLNSHLRQASAGVLRAVRASEEAADRNHLEAVRASKAADESSDPEARSTHALNARNVVAATLPTGYGVPHVSLDAIARQRIAKVDALIETRRMRRSAVRHGLTEVGTTYLGSVARWRAFVARSRQESTLALLVDLYTVAPYLRPKHLTAARFRLFALLAQARGGKRPIWRLSGAHVPGAYEVAFLEDFLARDKGAAASEASIFEDSRDKAGLDAAATDAAWAIEKARITAAIAEIRSRQPQITHAWAVRVIRAKGVQPREPRPWVAAILGFVDGSTNDAAWKIEKGLAEWGLGGEGNAAMELDRTTFTARGWLRDRLTRTAALRMGGVLAALGVGVAALSSISELSLRLAGAWLVYAPATFPGGLAAAAVTGLVGAAGWMGFSGRLTKPRRLGLAGAAAAVFGMAAAYVPVGIAPASLHVISASGMEQPISLGFWLVRFGSGGLSVVDPDAPEELRGRSLRDADLTPGLDAVEQAFAGRRLGFLTTWGWPVPHRSLPTWGGREPAMMLEEETTQLVARIAAARRLSDVAQANVKALGGWIVLVADDKRKADDAAFRIDGMRRAAASTSAGVSPALNSAVELAWDRLTAHDRLAEAIIGNAAGAKAAANDANTAAMRGRVDDAGAAANRVWTLAGTAIVAAKAARSIAAEVLDAERGLAAATVPQAKAVRR